MGLSEQEQRMLDEIESALYAEDPKFGSAMSDRAFSLDGQSSGGRGFSIRVVAVMLVGLVLLVGGVAAASVNAWFIALSIVGFAVMFGAGVWALTGSPSRGEMSVESLSKKRNSGRRSVKSSRNSGGSSSLESRFRDRFNNQ